MGSYGEIANKPSSKTTYMATCAPVGRVASATDMAIFNGSATKIVRVLKILVTYSVTGSGTRNTFYLVKRSTANSGGTSTLTAGIPLDSNNAAASSGGLRDYTANPTTGTSVGNINIITTVAGSNDATGSGPVPQMVIFDADKYGQALVLRGTAEGIAINNNGATPSGTSAIIGFTVIWTEE